MESVRELLLDEVKEKHIVDDILQMAAEMEHREKMKPIIENINEMVCFVFNTVHSHEYVDDLPVVTKLIFHYKYQDETDPHPDTETECVIFRFEEYEGFILDNINAIIEEKNEYFLTQEEYLSIYDINF